MVIGKKIKQLEGYSAFVPDKFPPKEKIILPEELQFLLNEATLGLGKLDGITQTLPDLDFFILMYIRKEAALSSSIEGTQATMIDSLDAELDAHIDLPEDVSDIFHYIDAMNYGLKALNEIPLSLRLIREVHRVLLTQGRADNPLEPGKFRSKQNWIGGRTPYDARFVPPPVVEMKRSLGDFEDFLTKEKGLMSPIIRAGLAHSQFETIHPFIDGNGRTGRLLITFFLCHQKVLEKPVLYLSEYFKKHRDTYFDLLHKYHNEGGIFPWLEFFLKGIIEVSEDAIDTSKKINRLRIKDYSKVSKSGRDPSVALKVLDQLYKIPVVNAAKIQEWAEYSSRSSAKDLLDKLLKMGILEQRDKAVTYGRTYWYKEYLDIFQK